MSNQRGDGGWIATAAEIVYEGHEDKAASAIAEVVSMYGIEAVLEVIECCADAAYDHLKDTDAPLEGISHEDARRNVGRVRECLRAAREVL